MKNANKGFWDRERCVFGLRVTETNELLLAEPELGITVVIVAVLSGVMGIAMIVCLHATGLFAGDLVAICIFFGIVAYTLAALVIAMHHREAQKGPLLRVNKESLTIALPRQNLELSFQEIEAIALLIRWYEWSDWEKVAEITFISTPKAGLTDSHPIVLHHNVRATQRLAERLAELLARPLYRYELSWKERQKRDR